MKKKKTSHVFAEVTGLSKEGKLRDLGGYQKKMYYSTPHTDTQTDAGQVTDDMHFPPRQHSHQPHNHIARTHVYWEHPWYHDGPRQKAVIGRHALWSHHWLAFFAKVKDRCCARRMASGESLMSSLIRRMTREKRARCFRFGAYYHTCLERCVQMLVCIVCMCLNGSGAGTEPPANKELWAWSEQHLLKHQLLHICMMGL